MPVTASVIAEELPEPTVLRGVRYADYVRYRSVPGNDGLRMVYHDGTLEIMSPQFRHERGAIRIGLLVAIVAGELDLPCTSSRSTTFRRAGDGPRKGKGKEPDQSFYLANEHRILDKETIDLDAGDPPPDLWVEVDNRASSRGRLPVYAALGVPEVWRHDVRRKRLWIGRLVGDRYERVDRSVALPMLSAGTILEILALGEGIGDAAWCRLVGEWVRANLAPG